MAGVKGADNVKRLSSQFIARFFGMFPDFEESSIDAMLDLCEDPNVDIRKQVSLLITLSSVSQLHISSLFRPSKTCPCCVRTST